MEGFQSLLEEKECRRVVNEDLLRIARKALANARRADAPILQEAAQAWDAAAEEIDAMTRWFYPESGEEVVMGFCEEILAFAEEIGAEMESTLLEFDRLDAPIVAEALATWEEDGLFLEDRFAVHTRTPSALNNSV